MVRVSLRAKISYALAVSFGLGFGAPARGDLARCYALSKQAVVDCTAYAESIKAAKNGSAAKLAAEAPGNGQSDNSFKFSGVTLNGAKADEEGKRYCEAKKESGCIAACTKEIDPKQKSQAEELKKTCVDKIEPILGELAASSGGLSTASMMAAATGLKALAGVVGASQGGGNSGGGSSGGGGLPDLPTGLPSPTTPTANNPPGLKVTPPPPPPPGTNPLFDTQANCNGSQAYILEECSGQMTTNCSGKFHSSGACESFSARFCAKTPDSGQGSQAALKAGEGVGTPYCTAYNGSSFCARAGTSLCPSCSGASPGPGAKLPDVCKNDPAFSNPQIAQTLSPTLALKTLSGSGGGPSGGGGGGGGGGLGPTSAAPATAVEATKLNPPATTRESLNLAVDGGGGGYSQNSDGAASGDYDSPLHSPARRALAANSQLARLTTLATDVEVKNTTSVFAISSQILHARCQSGRLLHCGTNAK